MGAAVADDGFDFRPGAQIPLLGGGGQTAATNALASAAYRDGGKDSKLDKILTANNENHPATVKPRRSPSSSPASARPSAAPWRPARSGPAASH